MAGKATVLMAGRGKTHCAFTQNCSFQRAADLVWKLSMYERRAHLTNMVSMTFIWNYYVILFRTALFFLYSSSLNIFSHSTSLFPLLLDLLKSFKTTSGWVTRTAAGRLMMMIVNVALIPFKTGWSNFYLWYAFLESTFTSVQQILEGMIIVTVSGRTYFVLLVLKLIVAFLGVLEFFFGIQYLETCRDSLAGGGKTVSAGTIKVFICLKAPKLSDSLKSYELGDTKLHLCTHCSLFYGERTYL